MDDALQQINNSSPLPSGEEISAEIVSAAAEILPTYEYFVASPYFANFGIIEPKAREEFLLIFCGLSLPLKKLLSSPYTAKEIYSFGEKFGLEEENITTVASLVREVVIGNIFVKDFPLMLADKLSIEQQAADTIANKIAADLFAPVIDSIKIVQKQKFADKIKLIQLEPQKIDEQAFIASQAKPFSPPPPATTPPTVEKPAAPVSLPQKPVPVASLPKEPLQPLATGPSVRPPMSQQSQPGPQPLRQPLPQLPKDLQSVALPPLSMPPKLIPKPAAPPSIPPATPPTPPPNLPRPEVKSEEKNVLDLRNK